jgi:DNA-binding Lrp family transcriptional regulator
MVQAYVLITVEGRNVESVLEQIRQAPAVSAVHAVTGPYDLIAFVHTEDLAGLRSLLVSQFHSLPEIAQTLTCVVL